MTITSRRTSTITRPLFSHHFHQLHATIAVAPFVIVPANYLYESIADHQRQLAVEDAGVRIAHDVLGNERLIAELEHAFVAFVRCRLLERGIDRVNCRILFQDSGQIRDRSVWSGRSEEHTSELQSHSDLVCRLLLEK